MEGQVTMPDLDLDQLPDDAVGDGDLFYDVDDIDAEAARG